MDSRTTEELRKRFYTEVNKWLDPMSDYGGKELVYFLFSEIEAAEKAKVEEVIEWLHEKGAQGWEGSYDHAAKSLEAKFLKNPEK